MKILKEYVKNSYRPETSIVERYIAKEAIEFCTNYMSEVDAIGVPKSWYEGRHEGKGTRCEGSLKRSTIGTAGTLVYFEQYSPCSSILRGTQNVVEVNEPTCK